jgi:hypothetical protein
MEASALPLQGLLRTEEGRIGENKKAGKLFGENAEGMLVIFVRRQ